MSYEESPEVQRLAAIWRSTPWARRDPEEHDALAPVQITSRMIGLLALASVDDAIRSRLASDPKMYYGGDFNRLLEKRADIVRQMALLEV